MKFPVLFLLETADGNWQKTVYCLALPAVGMDVKVHAYGEYRRVECVFYCPPIEEIVVHLEDDQSASNTKSQLQKEGWVLE